jgi:hypothetical protein
MKSHDKKDALHGVICSVDNCIHNNLHSRCTAEKIEVGPHAAHRCEETICESFTLEK